MASTIGAPITRPELPGQRVDEYVKKGKKVEVLAPSKRWRKATVVGLENGMATIHYAGFDSQFDEKVSLESGRFRPFGETRIEGVKTLKASFIPKGARGCCPGCGAKFQCVDSEAVGYLPQSRMVSLEEQEAKAWNPLTPEEEVKLLLKEGGVEERDSRVFASRSIQTTFRVVANVCLDLRKEPSVDAERVLGQTLTIGQTFQAEEIFVGEDNRTYFRVPEGKGWAFDWTMVNGIRMQLVAPVDDGARLIRREEKAHENVCMRCWALWQYNDCDDVLRPGTGTSPDLSAEKFNQLLRKTLDGVDKAIVLVVVDVFDFAPSRKMLQYLAEILAGRKGLRVKVIANKMDLLPVEVNKPRICGWISREAQKVGLNNVSILDVYPVSCHQQNSIKVVSKLLEQDFNVNKFYIVGAANVGKSSFLNRLTLRKRKGIGETPARAADGLTVSVLPGTTLGEMAVTYRGGDMKIVDTPGLLVPGTITGRLDMEELKAVVPQTKEGRRVTLHMMEGKSIMLGGLARIDMVEGRPMQFTVFTSEKVKLHMSRTHKVEAFCDRFAGKSLTPPFTQERYQEMLPWKPHRFETMGRGWEEASMDIVFSGLGWVSITGCGPCTVQAWAPEGIEVTMREPLMPFEAKWTGISYAGYPGWFKLGRRSVLGLDLGKIRRKIKNRKW